MDLFSLGAFSYDTLIEYCFIAGIKEANLLLNQEPYEPNCLFSYPPIDNEIFHGIKSFIFPFGIVPQSVNDFNNDGDNISTPTFSSFIMTNESGRHSYLYAIIIYETINVSLRTPIAFGFNSYINNTEAFKSLLNEIYLIIKSNLPAYNKKIDIIHYLLFIQNIKVPPMHSLLTIQLQFSSIDFYFSSHNEIPTVVNDTNINILFSVLELSRVIKLWLNVLYETKVIIYGNNPYILHAVIDAIIKLIFPLSYSCTIITCVPQSKIDILDLPCPYIIGVLSFTVSLEYLRKKYPNHCIVDLESGRVYSRKIEHLPQEEEKRINKEIVFLKHPELFQGSEVFKEEKEMLLSNSTIDSKYDFSTNVKYVFFRMMKEILIKYNDYISKENREKFNCNTFLSTIQNVEMKGIWEKIIKTNSFYLFYSEGKYLDDLNNTRIFNSIISEKYIRKDIHNCFRIKISINKVNVNEIEHNFNKLSVIDQNDNDDNSILIPNENNIIIKNKKDSNESLKFYSNEGVFALINSLLCQCSVKNQTLPDIFHINDNGINELHQYFKDIMSNVKSNIISTFNNININNNNDNDITLNNNHTESISCNKPIILIDLLTKDCFSQLYLFFAFNLQYVSNNDILNYYHKAYEINNDCFPYYKYYSFIQKQKYSLEQLEQIAKEIKGEQLKILIADLIKSKRHIPFKLKQHIINHNEINSNQIYFPSNTITLTNSKCNTSYIGDKNSSSSLMNVLTLKTISEQMKKEILIEKKSQKQINHIVIKDNTSISDKDNQNNTKTKTALTKSQGLSNEVKFTTPQILNIRIKAKGRSNPSELMKDIAQKLYQLITNNDYTLKTIYSDVNKELFQDIQESVNKLQRINLSKLSSTNEKYVFWLNAFNFLLLYTIIITQFKPKSFEDWKNVFMNSLYNIGGYEISLYQIEHLILNGNNIYQEKIEFTDSLIKKYSLIEDNILIDCALYFPIETDCTSLVVFDCESYLKQIEDITNQFFDKNIKYDQETKKLVVNNYILLLFPSFMEYQYQEFKDNINEALYKVINEKDYKDAESQAINWKTLFK